MQENTNRALVSNSLILYARLIISSLCGFFTTRYALQALGVCDFGLISLVGGIVTFLAIINTIMVSTSNRYIAVAIGNGNIENANKQFNICLIIHICITILSLLFAIPLGHWYIIEHLNYTGEMSDALIVFYISAIASISTFIGVPYSGLLVAKERFGVYCIPEILASIFKLFFVIILVDHFNHKLILYALACGFFSAFPTLYYVVYCSVKLKVFSKWNYVSQKSQYKEMLSFSGWVAYGAFAYVGKSQGAAILVNSFFDTVMNTALGIGNAISSITMAFSRSISQPIDPQITKSYVVNNMERCENLLVLSTKLTFYIVIIISAPFFVNANWILSLWLGNVPPYAAMFTVLILIDVLVESMNTGIKSIIFASGKIKLFQIIPSSLKLFSILLAYIILKTGTPPYSLFYTYIGITLITVICNQWILNKTLNFKNSILIKKSYLPSITISILSIIVTFIVKGLSPIIAIIINEIVLCALIFIIGLSKTERNSVIQLISNKK